MVDVEGPKRLIELFSRRVKKRGDAGKESTVPPPRKTPVKSPEVQINSLNVDKLHVFRIMNRETETPVPRKDGLFSKYAPLPGIKQEKQAEKPRRPLVREKTFKVLEPVYVRGPLDEKRIGGSSGRQELPKIEEKPTRSTKTAGSARSRTSSRTKGVELAAPRKNKTLSGKREVTDLPEIHVNYQGKGFCPSRIEDSGPAKTVFWFPV